MRSEPKLGAEGVVRMAKHIASGNVVAIKFHRSKEPRDRSAQFLARLSDKFVASVPSFLKPSEWLFDDPACSLAADHPYALVMEGADKASAVF